MEFVKHTDCSFTLDEEVEICRIISHKLTERAPFSLIRLGDGEGVLMSIAHDSPRSDFQYLAKHLGPDGIELEQLLALKGRLIHSVTAADVIGIRNDIQNVTFDASNFELPEEEFLRRFRGAFKLRNVEEQLPYAGCRRIALLHRSLSNLELPKDRRYCSAWLQYELHRSGTIFRLLRGQSRIGLISARNALPELLEKLTGVAVRYFEIPDMYRDLKTQVEGSEYIDLLESVLSEQLTEFPGMLFLIGGGLYGKLYCQAVKSQGGVALDVGSLLDAWLGIPSRPTVYQTLGHRPGKPTVPAELLLTADNISA